MPRQNSGWSNSKENEMKRGFKMCGVREAERCRSYFFSCVLARFTWMWLREAVEWERTPSSL
jgi:hypothetical protein